MDDNEDIAESDAPAGVGAQLRAARESMGLSLEQLSAETRIAQRHLTAIEADEFGKLPGRTYAVGFSRTFAKSVGLDQDDVAALVRAELDAQSEDGYRPAGFEPGDPARVPSRALGWFAAFAVLLLIAGMFFFFRTMFMPAGELPSLLPPPTAAKPSAAAAPKPAPVQPGVTSGQVTLTAMEQGIWVKIYDASGKTLFEKLMSQGESFTVPSDAKGPMLWTGRPDALTITVGGKPIARLADQQTVMKNVSLEAQALLARGSATPAAGPAVPVGEKPTPSAT